MASQPNDIEAPSTVGSDTDYLDNFRVLAKDMVKHPRSMVFQSHMVERVESIQRNEIRIQSANEAFKKSWRELSPKFANDLLAILASDAKEAEIFIAKWDKLDELLRHQDGDRERLYRILADSAPSERDIRRRLERLTARFSSNHPLVEAYQKLKGPDLVGVAGTGGPLFEFLVRNAGRLFKSISGREVRLSHEKLYFAARVILGVILLCLVLAPNLLIKFKGDAFRIPIMLALGLLYIVGHSLGSRADMILFQGVTTYATLLVAVSTIAETRMTGPRM